MKYATTLPEYAEMLSDNIFGVLSLGKYKIIKIVGVDNFRKLNISSKTVKSSEDEAHCYDSFVDLFVKIIKEYDSKEDLYPLILKGLAGDRGYQSVNLIEGIESKLKVSLLQEDFVGAISTLKEIIEKLEDNIRQEVFLDEDLKKSLDEMLSTEIGINRLLFDEDCCVDLLDKVTI